MQMPCEISSSPVGTASSRANLTNDAGHSLFILTAFRLRQLNGMGPINGRRRSLRFSRG